MIDFLKSILSRFRFLLRKLIISFWVITNKSDLKIIVGANSTKQNGWISTNYSLLNLCDFKTFDSLFKGQKVRVFLAGHLWEHLKEDDGLTAARHSFNSLADGGYLRVAVPDGFHIDKDYIDNLRPGGTGSGADDQLSITY